MTPLLPCAVLRLQANGAIIAADDELARMLGAAALPAAGRPFGELLTAGSRVLWESQVLPALATRGRVDEVYLRLRGAAGDVPVLVNSRLDRSGGAPEIYAVLLRMQRREQWELEIGDARRRATELAERLHAKTVELEAAKRELEESIAETISTNWMLERVADFLPICVDCGQVREGREWGSVVDYLKRNARFLSHGYCPDCAARFLEREGLAD